MKCPKIAQLMTDELEGISKETLCLDGGSILVFGRRDGGRQRNSLSIFYFTY
jgi:hypothetical protein